MNCCCRWLNRHGTWLAIKRIALCLWIAFALHALDAYSYFALSFSITLYFTESLGMSDEAASRYYAWYGGASVIFGVLSGPVIDRMGLKKSLLLGALVSTVARVLFAFSGSIPVVVLSLLIGVPLGAGLFQPPLHIAVDRYSALKATSVDEESEIKKMGFRFLYTAANVGAIVALLFTDFAIDTSPDLAGLGNSSDTNSSLAQLTCPTSFDLFNGGDDPGDSSDDHWMFEGYVLLFATAAAVSAFTVVLSSAFQEQRMAKEPAKLTWRLGLSTLREPNFYILLWFVTVLIPVRAMFKYMEALMPLYLTRTLPCAPYGTLLAVNPFGIIVLTPIVGVITRRVPFWALLVIGTFVSGVAPLLMYWWRDGPLYSNIWVSIGIFTLGEALYSPLISQYTLLLSPADKKGLYGGLILIPTFIGTFVAGEITVWLLATYCPRDGDPDRCHDMWLPVTLMSVSSSVLLLVMWVVLHPICKYDEAARAEGYVLQEDFEGDVELDAQN